MVKGRGKRRLFQYREKDLSACFAILIPIVRKPPLVVNVMGKRVVFKKKMGVAGGVVNATRMALTTKGWRLLMYDFRP